LQPAPDGLRRSVLLLVSSLRPMNPLLLVALLENDEPVAAGGFARKR
jgi:hypothetical protein